MGRGKRDLPASPESPDVEIAAGARARELRFEETPGTETRFWGDHRRESASGSDRDNLPSEIEPQVIYRNAGIRWRAASKLTVDYRSEERR